MTRKIRFLPQSQIPILVFLCGLLFLRAGFAQDAAPALELPDATGQLRKLSDYRGKIVVLNFWATWCGPCAAEMSRFVDAQRRYEAQGVVVVAASLDAAETKKNIPVFITKHKINFPVLTDATVDHMKQFAMGDVLPGTAFLDKEGRIVARILGEAKKGEVFDRIDWLLGVKKGKEPKALLDKTPKRR